MNCHSLFFEEKNGKPTVETTDSRETDNWYFKSHRPHSQGNFANCVHGQLGVRLKLVIYLKIWVQIP